jgi:hypothetical protein
VFADECENVDFCAECGGVCCWLYLAHDENGEFIGEEWLPDYIDLWLGRFVDSGALVRDGDRYVAGPAGIEPLHDPRQSYPPTAEGEAYRASLPGWVDTRMCQFCHPDTGCILPRDHRAPICREWRCDAWPGEG